MMKFDVQSLVDRESAERGREFGEWAAACGRNRERMQEIGETAAGAAYQISVGGCGRAEMWLYVDSDEKCVRVAGFETVADDLGHVGEFITLTCPSRFHAAAAASGERNPKYDGSTPRDASAYLQRVWARIRSALAKEDIKIYGFRVAEPHHDGCPHWHGLFFMPSEQRGRFREIVALHGCREDREELGLDYFCRLRRRRRRRGRCAMRRSRAAGGRRSWKILPPLFRRKRSFGRTRRRHSLPR